MRIYRLLFFIALFWGCFLSPVLHGQKVKSESKNGVYFSVLSPPEIFWEDHQANDTIHIDFNTLALELGIDSRLKLVSVNVFVNNILAENYQEVNLLGYKRTSGHNFIIPLQLVLRPGINAVKVIAKNEKGIEAESVKLVRSTISGNLALINEKDKNPPQILVSSPANTRSSVIQYSKDIIPIRGTVIDEAGVQLLKINGHKTPIKSNGNFIINLPLSMGQNEVIIEAMDINNNTSLKRFVIERRDLDGTEYVAAEAKNYLFIVGVDQYQHWPPLNNAVRDARDVAEVLTTKFDFDSANMVLLTDSLATRKNIYNELKGLVERVSLQDNLVIYYSGHGHFDELLNEGYWVPYEADVESEGDYLPNSSLVKILQNINSQHIFLVVDACFSGSLFASSSRGYVENVEKYRSRWALASGRLETVSDGELGKNSPFAESFIRYLDESTKEKITVSEIVQYVKVNVSEVSKQTPLGNPLKNIGDEGGEFVFHRKD